MRVAREQRQGVETRPERGREQRGLWRSCRQRARWNVWRERQLAWCCRWTHETYETVERYIREVFGDHQHYNRELRKLLLLTQEIVIFDIKPHK